MTTDTPTGKPLRQSRWLFPALIASLALNLLVVGGLGAAAWHHRHGPRGGDEAGLVGFIRELPNDRQAVVRDQVTAARDETRALRTAMRDAWSEANSALTVEPFDKEKFKAAAARQFEAEARYKSAINASLADTAAMLSADERRILQAWREKRRMRFFDRRDKGADDK